MCVQANEALQNVIDSNDQEFHDRELEALRVAEHRNEELEARHSLFCIWFSLHADKAVYGCRGGPACVGPACGFTDCQKRKAEAMEEGRHIARRLSTQPAERSGCKE